MVVLLHLFAILLILAGGAAGLYGADNIRADSGAAWLQTGGAIFAIGFVTLGLGAALRELKKIRRALTEIGDDLEPAAKAAQAAPAPAPEEAAPVIPLAAAAAIAHVAAAEALAESAETAPPAPPRQPPPIEPGEFERSVAGDAGASLAAETTEPEPAAEQPVAAAAPAEPEPEPEPAAEPVPPTVVATYTSGGVQYFMYSDGGIEAEMDKGRYRFPSMTELRRFVETGEGGVLIAPASGEVAANEDKAAAPVAS